MSSPTEIPPKIIHAIDNVKIAAYFDVAAVVVFLYDYILTFATEVDYIWFKPFSFVTVLFYITRYLPFFDTVSLFLYSVLAHPRSKAPYTTLTKMQDWSFSIAIVMADLILVLRTTAIWGNDKRIGWFLLLLLLAVSVPSFVMVGIFISEYTFMNGINSSDAVVNIPTHTDKRLLIAYSLYLFFDTVILVLSLLKSTGQTGRSAVYITLYRDSLLFYIYLFALSVINICLMAAGPVEIASALLTTVHRVLHAIFTVRIVLNIRSAAMPGTPQISGASDLNSTHAVPDPNSFELQNIRRGDLESEELGDDDDRVVFAGPPSMGHNYSFETSESRLMLGKDVP